MIKFFCRFEGPLLDEFNVLDKKMPTLVPKVLEGMLLESRAPYNSSTAIIYCVARSFRASKNAPLQISTRGINLETCRKVLSLLRAGVCSRILYYQRIGKPELANKAAKECAGDTSHEVNDLILRLRDTEERQPANREFPGNTRRWG